MKRSIAGYVLTLFLLVLVLVCVRGPQPPAVVPAGAPADQFSAERAFEHLQAIARKPHAMGTAEHARVRAYIVEQLEALGQEPRLQETTFAETLGHRVVYADAVNVLARLEGREDGKAVLLMSHYDTVPASPGAGDDGSGVAAMLETLRALREGPPLKNDVIFLFTDGEEVALVGARVFADEHPWADDVGVVLNFEARGTSGPALMFETSDGNGPLVGAFQRAMARPAASSYSYEVYRRMPNDTDYSVFRRADNQVPGLNFAFIHGGTTYHTAQDELDKLDPRSVQHLGDAALSLARHFGEADLDGDWKTRDAIYFNTIGTAFVGYSGAWALPIAALLLIATLVLLVWGFRRGKLSAGGFFVSLAAVLVGAGVVGWLVGFLAGNFVGFYNFVLGNGWTSTSTSYIGLGLVAVGLTLLLFVLLRIKLGAADLCAAGLLVWTILTLAVSVLAAGASYLFALPLALALAAWALWFPSDAEKDVSIRLVLVLAALLAVTAVLWAPMMTVLAVALGPGAGMVVGAFVFLIFLALLVPSLDVMMPSTGKKRWLAAASCLVLGLAVLLVVRAGSRFDSENRRFTNVFYYLDAETSEAKWFSTDRRTNAWSSQYLGENPERQPMPEIVGRWRSLFVNDAPVLPLDGPLVEWLGEESGPDTSTVRFNVAWPFDVHRVNLFLRSDAEIRSVAAGGGKAVTPGPDTGPGDQAYRKLVAYYAPPAEGLPVTVELAGEGPLEIEVAGQRYALPELEGFPVEPRPDDMMPGFSWTSDSTFVRTSVTWTPGTAAAVPEEDGGGGEDASDSP